VSVLCSAWLGTSWLVRRVRRGYDPTFAHEDAFGCTILFCLFNVAYLALVTVALSDGEQNRYRFKVTPLYFVMFGVLVWTAWNAFRYPQTGDRRRVRS
jgi:hypothetical protein